jgi:hypothetical protein
VLIPRFDGSHHWQRAKKQFSFLNCNLVARLHTALNFDAQAKPSLFVERACTAGWPSRNVSGAIAIGFFVHSLSRSSA